MSKFHAYKANLQSLRFTLPLYQVQSFVAALPPFSLNPSKLCCGMSPEKANQAESAGKLADAPVGTTQQAASASLGTDLGQANLHLPPEVAFPLSDHYSGGSPAASKPTGHLSRQRRSGLPSGAARSPAAAVDSPVNRRQPGSLHHDVEGQATRFVDYPDTCAHASLSTLYSLSQLHGISKCSIHLVQ